VKLRMALCTPFTNEMKGLRGEYQPDTLRQNLPKEILINDKVLNWKFHLHSLGSYGSVHIVDFSGLPTYVDICAYFCRTRMIFLFKSV
jgi:hypothetical protein